MKDDKIEKIEQEALNSLNDVKSFAEKYRKQDINVENVRTDQTSVGLSKNFNDLFSHFTTTKLFIFPSDGKFGYNDVKIKPLTLQDEMKIRNDIYNLSITASQQQKLSPEQSYVLLNKMLNLSIISPECDVEKLSLNDYISLLFFVLLFNSPQKKIIIEDTTYTLDNIDVVILEKDIVIWIQSLFKELYGQDVVASFKYYPIMGQESLLLNFVDKDIKIYVSLYDFFREHKLFIFTNKEIGSNFLKIFLKEKELNNNEKDFVLKQTELGKYLYYVLSVVSTGTDGEKLYYGIPTILKMGEMETSLENLMSQFFRRFIST